MPETLPAYLAAAREAALRGAAVLEQWRGKFRVQEKGRFNLVSEADHQSQLAIKTYLHERFPGHGFLGEEGDLEKDPGPDAPPTWVVDPLDGTTNYVHDCPLYCVSIGLQVKGRMAVGVVYDPSRREMFHAARGTGAYLNDRPIRVSTADSLEYALLSCGFPSDPQKQLVALEWFRRFSLCTQSLRRTGSTALNLAYVAAGRFDGYFGFGNHAWDVAGGAVLVEEAGGRLSNLATDGFDPYHPATLGSNGRLHPEIVRVIAGCAPLPASPVNDLP